MNTLIEKLRNEQSHTPDDWRALLDLTDPNELKALYEAAYQVKRDTVGPIVYFRGIVELSNMCSKDCYYCGIRRSNTKVNRYLMPEADIVRDALWAHRHQYGSIVLQAGERQDAPFVAMIERVLQQITTASNGELGITLSLGEQTPDTYRRWFEAGAHRYLLRIETSNRVLYQHLHPATHDFERRLDCLRTLRSLGYQVGTGVMIGLPRQTTDDLAQDIVFFREHDIDMVGMGPFIPHPDTPLGTLEPGIDPHHQLTLGLNMIAVTRLVLRDVNIAATTALQALNPTGREMGLQAGANIIMPNLTATRYRRDYQLYQGKPCLNEDSDMCRGCLQRRIDQIGETIGHGQWGDAPHFRKRQHPHEATA